jgi:pyruvate-formate lyase-activating enzyme
VPLKKPSELFEQRRKQSLEEELAQKKNQEDEKIKNKKIVSPKELFGETLEEEVLVEEPLVVEEIVEEPVDPYLEEIEALKSDLEKISYAIPEETDLTEVYQNIENLKNRIDDLPKQKSYDEDIQSIREELERIEGSIPVPEVFDPSDLYENISALKNKLEEVRSEIPTIPEPILYDHQLDQLKEMVVDVRNSIPVVPEIRYYEDELNEIINAIEGVRSEIPELPELPELPEIKYYDDEISTIESRLVEIQESIPTVKYYDDELDILDQKIANVKESIPVVPEIKYYDKDVKELKEQIASVKKSIPEVKYYDKDVKELKEKIDSVKNSIPVVPEVKYYDEDIQGLNEEVQDLYKKVSSIKIPDQDKYIREVRGLYSSFEEKNHRLLEKINYLEEVFEKFNEETLTEGLLNEPPEVKNSDPLTPLDKNFVTLDQLKDHYRLFINRIQQQLSTIGGGGETRLEFLDDVDRTSAKVNGRFLKYDAASGKWIGALGGGGGSQTLDDTLGLGNTSSLGMSVGIITATKYYGDGSSLTGISAGGITSTSSINTTGIITANSYYVGSTQVINSAGQWVGSGLSVYSNIDGGVPNSIYGGIPVIDGGVP